MKKTPISRRDFLGKSAVASTALTTGTLAACSSTQESKIEAPYINFNKTYLWKMVTTWPPNFPVIGEGCNLLADWVEKMSGGRMKIQVYGGGELIPPFESFDAVRNGAVEMGHGSAYYWAGKIPAAQFFSSVPFGMISQQMIAWMINGGGDKLWERVYEPFNLIPIICGNTGLQMGGWFNKEINSLQDIQGLKMRIPGLGGRVFNQVGGTSVLVAGGEIFTNLERGVIDATEWIGPYNDYLMGFHQVARYYYYPGWHEPGTVLELVVNRPKFLELPTDLQEIIRDACYRVNSWMWTEFDAQNSIYLNKILEEEKDTQLVKFPDEVMQELRSATEEVVQDFIADDNLAKEIYQAYRKFQVGIEGWSRVAEKEYYRYI